MDNITDNKMLSHIDRIISQKPITADVFLTNYCNNNCKYCTYKRWDLKHSTKAMTYDEFVTYAERMIDLGVQGIILTGGGEPTICPDFTAITQWLEVNNIPYGINTNFNKLVYCKPKYLKVSLDGYNEESYNASRGVYAYNKVRENIKAYAKWKQKNSPNTSLGIQWVATDVEGAKRFYEANKDLAVDYIVFRPIESTAGEFYADENAEKHVANIVEVVKKLAEKDSRVKLNFKWNYLHEKMTKCNAQYAQLAINEYGEVMYCCHKPYEVVGHILDADILQKKKEAKTNMSMCDIPCRMTAPNLFVQQTEKQRKDAEFI